MFGLSGTPSFGPTGTGNSVHREPGSTIARWNHAAILACNDPNKESFGFLLTPVGLSRAGTRLPPIAARPAIDGDPWLTHVTLVWREGMHEDWLRFGKPVAERIIDRRTRIESYAPGQVFAFVRWASNDYGTVRSRLDVLLAVGEGEPVTRFPQITPGAEILLSVSGWRKVERVFKLIDAIEALGIDPCEVAPDHWRHVHNRLIAAETPRGYSPARHRAWLARKKLQS